MELRMQASKKQESKAVVWKITCNQGNNHVTNKGNEAGNKETAKLESRLREYLLINSEKGSKQNAMLVTKEPIMQGGKLQEKGKKK